MPRISPAALAARVASAAVAILLVACDATATPTAEAALTPVPAATPGPVGGGLGALPGVEGFAYREQPAIVPGFLAGAQESLAGAGEVEIVQAAVASRGDEEVAVIAFAFPGATDAEGVDFMARIIDGMEDGFQAGAERGLDGEGFVMNFGRETVVVAPWGHTEDGQLAFLFFRGPTQPTSDLAAAILNAVD